MASTLKVDQIETPSGVGNISFAQPISGDGSQLTGVGLAVGGGAVVAGDFLYHDGVEWTRLPKGTAAQYLRMNAGATAPEWIATHGSTNASDLTSGTLPDGRFPATLPAISGASLTSLPAHSGNVAFPATQVASADANTLDDYEEGTWSPQFSDGTNDATQSTTVGRYIKIGKTVIFWGRVICTSLGSMSGNVQIANLPFVSENVGNLNPVASFSFSWGFNITAGYVVGGHIFHNVSHIRCDLWDATAGTSRLQASELTATAQTTFSGTYQASA